MMEVRSLFSMLQRSAKIASNDLQKEMKRLQFSYSFPLGLKSSIYIYVGEFDSFENSNHHHRNYYFSRK